MLDNVKHEHNVVPHCIVESIEKTLPAFRDKAIADCVAHLCKHGDQLGAARFLCHYSDSDAIVTSNAQSAARLLRILLENARTSSKPEVELDTAVQCLAFVCRHLARNPTSRIRASVTNTLSPEGSGDLGLYVLILALQRTKPKLRQRLNPIHRPSATPDEYREFIKRYVNRIQGSSYFLSGQRLNRDVIATEDAGPLLTAAMKQVQSIAANPDELEPEILLIVVKAALDLAATCSDEVGAGVVLSMAASALTMGHANQKARDLAEHSLLLSENDSASRRRLAWSTFADVYARCQNPIESGLGWLVTEELSDSALPDETLFYERTVHIRVLRDLHMWEEAANEIHATRELVENQQMLAQLAHLEGTILIARASNHSLQTPARLASLNDVIALLRGPLSSELADGELPAASLAVEVIRLAENLGRPVDNALRAIKDRLAIVTSEDGALCHARNTLPPRRTSRFSCQLLRVPFQPTMFHVTHIG